MEKQENYSISFNYKNILLVLGFCTLFIFVLSFLFSFLSNRGSNPSSGDQETPVETDQVKVLLDENMLTDLKIEDEVVGDGQEVKAGDSVSVNYRGRLVDGTEFDNSYDRGTPFEFSVGRGQVIAGWDQGLVGMKVGGKRILTIPPELGYGEEEAGGVIPPNSTLIFEIELLEIK